MKPKTANPAGEDSPKLLILCLHVQFLLLHGLHTGQRSLLLASHLHNCSAPGQPSAQVPKSMQAAVLLPHNSML